MSNPNHGEDGRFTEAPDPWEALRESGISPEEFMRWGQFGRDVNNLDRRQQALQSVIRPDIDTWIAQQAEEPPDPYAQYYADEEPEQPQQYYEQPGPPPIDPRQYAETIVNQARQDVVTWPELHRMMADQQYTEAAASAAQAANLPPGYAQVIDQQARQLSAQQPNRAPAELAAEVARQHATAFAEWSQAQAPPGPAPPSTPSGPSPTVDYQPPSPQSSPADAEAWEREMSRQGLD